MNTNDNFDALWANLRNSVAEARTPVAVPEPPKQLSLQINKGPMAEYSDSHHRCTIEVSKEEITMVRAGALMRCRLTSEEAIQLAANLIAIHA